MTEILQQIWRIEWKDSNICKVMLKNVENFEEYWLTHPSVNGRGIYTH